MQIITRKLERNIIRVAAGWEIISGAITIFMYSTWLKSQTLLTDGMTGLEAKSVETLSNTYMTFTNMIGLLFITLGVINIVMTIKMKDNTVIVNQGRWCIVCGIISLLLFDFISMALLVAAGIITLAKNKAIRTINVAKINGMI